jgi:hypothetical protein
MIFEPNSLALKRNDSGHVKQLLRESCGRLVTAQKLMLITYAMSPASGITRAGLAADYPQYPQAGL